MIEFGGLQSRAIVGDVGGDGTLMWNVNNWASIWINGQQLTNHSGTRSTVTTTTGTARSRRAWLRPNANGAMIERTWNLGR